MDAKVDALVRKAGIRFDPLDDVALKVCEALQHGHTILAIRRLRRATGVGLKEA
jgi:ribosomal protein L7/L12